MTDHRWARTRSWVPWWGRHWKETRVSRKLKDIYNRILSFITKTKICLCLSSLAHWLCKQIHIQLFACGPGVNELYDMLLEWMAEHNYELKHMKKESFAKQLYRLELLISMSLISSSSGQEQRTTHKIHRDQKPSRRAVTWCQHTGRSIVRVVSSFSTLVGLMFFEF